MLYSVSQYPTLSHEFINLYVSDYDIYSHYLGKNFSVGQTFNSPFHEDLNPSFGIYDVGNGKLLFKDFSKSLDGNVITFVQLHMKLPDFKSALIQIYLDLIVNQKKIPLKNLKVERQSRHRNSDVGVKRQPFNKTDLEWWNEFHISKEILELFEVSAAKYMFVGPYIKHEYTKDNPMYVYKVYDKLKIYRPLSDKKQKWYGSLTRNYIHGYKQLPDKGNLLIITKSLKDLMCLHSLGYTAISPSAEGTLVPEHIINKLKKRFKNIVVFYDNDEPGINYAKRMCKRYNLEYRIIPNESQEKDTTDFLKRYGVKKTEEELNKLFREFLVSGNNINPDEETNSKKKTD